MSAKRSPVVAECNKFQKVDICPKRYTRSKYFICFYLIFGFRQNSFSQDRFALKIDMKTSGFEHCQYSETDAEPNVKVRFRPLFFRGKLRASPQPAVQSDKAKDESSEVSQYMSEQDGKIFELHPSMVLSSYYQNVIDCHSASAIKPPLFRKVRIATSGRETRRTTQSCLI